MTAARVAPRGASDVRGTRSFGTLRKTGAQKRSITLAEKVDEK
jgi:hypothetical protein